MVVLWSSVGYSAESIRDLASKGNLAGVKAAIARGENKDSKSSRPIFSFGSVGFNKEGALSYQQDAEWTPLIHAAFKGHTNVVNYLLEIGADPNVVDYNGLTALMYAINKKDIKTVETFATYTNAINFKEPQFKMTPLMWAMVQGDINIVKSLSTTKTFNVQDVDGWTVLHYAVDRGRLDCVNLLLSSEQLDINTIDKVGKTSLMIASENGEAKIVQLLVKSGATLSARSNEGKTALDYAKGKLGLKGLKAEKINRDTVRIAEGFVYQRNMELSSGQSIRIMDIEGGIMRTEGTVAMGAESAVGTTWIFDKPSIILHNGDYIYKSKVKDATIKFTKEGVLLQGFSIENPHEDGIKKVIAILQGNPKDSSNSNAPQGNSSGSVAFGSVLGSLAGLAIGLYFLIRRFRKV